jgi:hypothetical protein
MYYRKKRGGEQRERYRERNIEWEGERGGRGEREKGEGGRELIDWQVQCDGIRRHWLGISFDFESAKQYIHLFWWSIASSLSSPSYSSLFLTWSIYFTSGNSVCRATYAQTVNQTMRIFNPTCLQRVSTMSSMRILNNILYVTSISGLTLIDILTPLSSPFSLYFSYIGDKLLDTVSFNIIKFLPAEVTFYDISYVLAQSPSPFCSCFPIYITY